MKLPHRRQFLHLAAGAIGTIMRTGRDGAASVVQTPRFLSFTPRRADHVGRALLTS
jgi:hypothetical protein